MFIGFIVLFSSMPAILDESDKIAKFSEIPYLWLLVPITLHLLLGAVGFRGYEWSAFGDDERKAFLRRFSILAVVEVFCWYGGFLSAAAFGWTYDTAFWVSIAPPTVLVVFWHLNKPRKELWD